MNWRLLSRMLGLLGMLVGGSMLFSLPWAFPACGQTAEFESRGFWGLVASIGCSVGVGGVLYLYGRSHASGILKKEALATVGLGWILAGVLGGLPFLFSGVMRHDGERVVRVSVADAVFESVSGFTTTGASVLTQLESPDTSSPPAEGREPYVKLIPRCVLFWRCFTHWLGGMGIIVLFVAILGQLGAGGKALMRREVPGPINEAVRPRVRETAVVMWAIYVGISAVETVILQVEGMSLYDALCHTFGTMATGGFSTHNASVGHFQSPLIEMTLTVFMVLAGTNFSLYYLVLRGAPRRKEGLWQRFKPLFGDPEYRVFLAIIAVATVLLTFSLLWNNLYDDPVTSVRHALFTSVSIMTTTGFGTEDFHKWSEFAKGLLLMLMFVGGCAGSTGGGIKVIRWMLFVKVIRLETEQAFRPNVVRPMRIFGVKVDADLRHEVVVYFSIMLAIFMTSWMLLASIEPDAQWRSKASAGSQADAHVDDEKLLDCASAVAATLNNIGPGVGVLGPHSNYSQFSDPGKVLMTVLMLLGRLELFAILVLFFPSFWRNQ